MGANKMWGGRFQQAPAEIMEKINASISFDQKLWPQDIEGSKAHAQMLHSQGILTSSDFEAITKGLTQIAQEIEAGTFSFKTSLEDIHMNIESRLAELIGEPAGRLHTARSRNDQVATDFKMWVRDQIDLSILQLKNLREALLTLAQDHTKTYMPGFTHLQSAQPVSFAHHLMAYFEMFTRDQERFEDCRSRLNLSPLGAAALAGTGFAIDRTQTAKSLGFEGPTRNSLDSVSDRDFALEFMSSASILGMHLSRFAEEIVLWCSQGYNFIELSDSFTTGSSIMPQKRNPDAAELIRAKVGRFMGGFTSLLITMKALPLSYSKDMQEDKEVTFEVADSLSLALEAMTGLVQDMKPHKENLQKATQAGHITATDLADWLVRELNMPFRKAHEVTGTLVRLAETQNLQLSELSLDQLQSVHPKITSAVFSVLTVEASVNSRTSFGGTAPVQVEKAIEQGYKSLQLKS